VFLVLSAAAGALEKKFDAVAVVASASMSSFRRPIVESYLLPVAENSC
jgi:hypothetical protein